jgi:hypothetical protein
VVSHEGTKPDLGKIDAVVHFSSTKDSHGCEVFSRTDWVLSKLCSGVFTINCSLV